MRCRAALPGKLVSDLTSRLFRLLGKRPVERLDFLMGTVVAQKVYGRRAVEASNRALDEMQRLERMLSAFLPESDVSRINTSAGCGPVVVSAETAGLLEKAVQVSELSGGAFDVTTGPLNRLWSVTADRPQVPPHEKIISALMLVGYDQIRLDPRRQSCFLPLVGQAIDLGGIAKGYAADRAVQMYRDSGVRSALIDLGGNVAALGGRPSGEPWIIGIQDPRGNRGDVIGTLSLKDTSAVTSGGYERGFSSGGAWHHHIIDPRSGYPSRSDIASVTVVADESMMADALSTAAFVMGSEPAMELLSRTRVEGLLVRNDGSILITEDLKRRFQLLAPATVRPA